MKRTLHLITAVHLCLLFSPALAEDGDWKSISNPLNQAYYRTFTYEDSFSYEQVFVPQYPQKYGGFLISHTDLYWTEKETSATCISYRYKGILNNSIVITVERTDGRQDTFDIEAFKKTLTQEMFYFGPPMPSDPCRNDPLQKTETDTFYVPLDNPVFVFGDVLMEKVARLKRDSLNRVSITLE